MTSATGAAPLPRDAIARIDWGSVSANAARVAAKIGMRVEDVREVVNEGVRRVLDGTSPWNEEGGMPLAEHVARVGIAALRASCRTHQRRSAQAAGIFVDSMAPPPSSPEAIVARSENARRNYDLLVRHFAGDTQALAICACIMGSITEASDQARHTGLGIETVHNIRKRVHRRIDALREGAPT